MAESTPTERPGAARSGAHRPAASDPGLPAATPPRESPAVRPRPRHCGPPAEFKREDIEQTISSRFEQQVARYPERPAVRTRTATVTYDALNRAANRIASAVLSARGPEPEPIGLILDNGAQLLAAALCANDSETLASPGITVVEGGERWLSDGEPEEGKCPPAAGRSG